MPSLGECQWFWNITSKWEDELSILGMFSFKWKTLVPLELLKDHQLVPSMNKIAGSEMWIWNGSKLTLDQFIFEIHLIQVGNESDKDA